MGCVGEKPKPQPNDNKVENKREQNAGKQGSNVYGASAQPEYKQLGENKVPGQSSQNSMVKLNKDDPLKIKDPYGSREGFNNPYESNTKV